LPAHGTRVGRTAYGGAYGYAPRAGFDHLMDVGRSDAADGQVRRLRKAIDELAQVSRTGWLTLGLKRCGEHRADAAVVGPGPSMICVILDHILGFLSTQIWSYFGYTLSSLLFL
jgi:hypothetical protein